MDERKIRYVLLRWFEHLEKWPEGEDMDILIENDGVAQMEDLFVVYDRSIACDLYSVYPQPSSDYEHGAYYPPLVAQQIIDSRISYQSRCFVPDPLHHFRSLVYHAVYHKAEHSGLPWSRAEPRTGGSGDHDYAKIVRELADQNGIDIEPTFLGLHEYLKSQGWAPPTDTLRRLAGDKRKWLLELLPEVKASGDDGELMFFMLREAVLKNDFLKEAKRIIVDAKLDIIDVRHLDPKEVQRAMPVIRGGNWRKGPYPKSGGGPAVAVIAFDYHPKPTSDEHRQHHPYVTNDRVFIKNRVRSELNQRLPRGERTNCIHAADDEIETLENLDAIDSAWKKDVQEAVRQRREAYATTEEVVRRLESSETRSKVEVIRWGDGLAVKKTFKANRERYLEREIFAYTELAAKCKYVPRLIDSGDNYCTLPYFENKLAKLNKEERHRVLRNYGREIVDVMRAAYECGRTLVNFYDGNVIVTPDDEIVFIDFEFMQCYEKTPAHFSQCYDVAGLPDDFAGDLPRGMRPPGMTYANTWQAITQTELDAFLG
ncbi:MAG: hypothetical protein P8M08_06725 [Akkermansiaceae bacterium]|nr:hypothetical protein [Akkermansiaceae bacterium]